MREERVIALAGVFQAIALVRMAAQRGTYDPAAMQPSLASILRIDAPNAAAVFGGVQHLNLGLETLIAQLDDAPRDLAISRLAISVLRVQGKIMRRPQVMADLRERINVIAHGRDDALSRHSVITESASIDDGAITATLIEQLAQLYVDTISKVSPRILVEGDQQYLGQSKVIERIRTLLLAAIRAAVLWQQLGGSQWRLLFRRRQYAMMARGLLAQSTLVTKL